MDQTVPLDVDEISATEILRAVTDDRIDPAALPPEARRRCVQYLADQGFTVGESAQTLATSDRTIQRDRAALRQDNALQPSPSLGDELMGELRHMTAASNERLMRLARDEKAPPYVKVWAENTMVKNQLQLIKQARELGYFADATPRLNEMIEEDPGTKRRQAKTDARIRAIIHGAPAPGSETTESSDAKSSGGEVFDPQRPQPVLEEIGVEEAVDHTRARLVYLEHVLRTDTTEKEEAEREEDAKSLALIERTRTGLEQIAASLHDTIEMERDYVWEANDDDPGGDDDPDGGGGDDDDDGDERDNSNGTPARSESPPPPLAA